ncbi:MAG: hypothetical protein QOC89_3571 [Paraburkholderia sp.]|nr:hypothetical protein [Paraburkholderia sp.]
MFRLAAKRVEQRTIDRQCLRDHQLRRIRRRPHRRHRTRLRARHRGIKTHSNRQYRLACPQPPRVPVLLFHFILLIIYFEEQIQITSESLFAVKKSQTSKPGRHCGVPHENARHPTSLPQITPVRFDVIRERQLAAREQSIERTQLGLMDVEVMRSTTR